MSVWIGVDLGTQSVRAVAAADDTPPRVVSRPLRGVRANGTHEQQPHAWWTATAGALTELTAGLDRSRVAGVAVSGTSGTVLLTDGDGRPTSPGLMYDDARAASLLEAVHEADPDLWRRQGVLPSGTWAIVKIAAWARARALDGDRRLAHQADWVAGRLVGEPVPADTGNALKSGADPEAVAWPSDLLRALDVPPTAVPALVLPGAAVGEVGAEAARATGLPAGTPVIAGTTDGCAAQIAAGAVGPGSWNSVLGTTLVLKGVSTVRRPDPGGALYCHRAPLSEPALWYPGGASSSGAGLLADLFGDADLDALTAAARARPGPVPVAYPLSGVGERFPFVRPDAVGHIASRALPAAVTEDPVGSFAALLHAVAHVERLGFDLAGSLGYDVSGQVSLTGGATRNAWWTQLRADVLGVEVLVPSLAEGALGMAVLARAALDSSATAIADGVASLAPPPSRVHPEPSRSRQLDDAHAAFVSELDGRGWIGPDLRDGALRRAAS